MSSTCFEPKGHFKEDGCIYSYGILRFTCIGIGILASPATYWTAYTDVNKTHYTIPVYTCTTAFLKMDPRVRNM